MYITFHSPGKSLVNRFYKGLKGSRDPVLDQIELGSNLGQVSSSHTINKNKLPFSNIWISNVFLIPMYCPPNLITGVLHVREIHFTGKFHVFSYIKMSANNISRVHTVIKTISAY